MTARTPGISRASVASIDLILAWAYGLRTMSIQTMFGRMTSSMYSPLPRMNRGSSLRFTEWPHAPDLGGRRGARCASRVIVVSPRSGADAGSPGAPALLGLAELAGGLLDRP